MVRPVARKEGAIVVDALNESVNRVTVGLNARNDARTVLVGDSLWFADTLGASRHGLIVDACSIVNMESHVFHAVAVLSVVSRELLRVGVQRRSEHESDFVVFDNVRAKFTLTSFQSLSGKIRDKNSGSK